MGAGSTTLRAATRPDGLDAALQAAGVRVVADAEVTLTVLDSFDGRVAASGQRLLMRRSVGDPPATASPVMVSLRGDGAPVEVRRTERPVTALDFPRGPLRERIGALLGERVLLPLLEVSAQRMDGVYRGTATAPSSASVLVLDDVSADGERLAGSWIVVEELRGYDGSSTDLLDLLNGLGYEPVDTPVFEAAAALVGVDLAGTSIDPGIPLDPQTSAIDGFRAVLENLREAIAVNYEGTIGAVDTEFLHDLRVAVRRSRAVLGAATTVIDPGALARAKAGFREVGQFTSPVRDLDVYQLEWPSYVEGLDADATAALEPVRAFLAERGAAAQAVLVDQLRSDPVVDFWAWWDAWLATPETAGGDDERTTDATDKERHAVRRADQPLPKVVRRRIRQAHRRMVDRGREIGPATPATELHELRKDAKKLRYLIECFGGLYDPDARKPFVQRLKAMQDNLGEHQDAEVHSHALHQLAGEVATQVPLVSVLAMGRLIERLEQKRQHTRDEFAERFAEFDSDETEAALKALLRSAGSGR